MKHTILLLFLAAAAHAGYAPRPSSGASIPLALTGSNLSGALLEELATNSSIVPDSNKEVVIKTTGAGANVLALRNTNTTGYGAITFRDSDGNEGGAVGLGNSGTGRYAGKNYWQFWSGTGAPTLLFAGDGNYGPIGTGFRTYDRMTMTYDGGFGIAETTIFKLIPVSGGGDGIQRPSVIFRTDANTQGAHHRIITFNNDVGYQIWKDATPTKAIDIGLNKPGAGALGDDIVFSVFNGSAWVEAARFKNGTRGINLSSIPTSSSGLASGDVYSNAGVLTIVP